MKIKVLTKTEGCFPQVFGNGDWIDLRTARDVAFRTPHAKCLHKKKEESDAERTRDVVFSYGIIPLGVAMQLPEGYEAVVVPRSGTFRKYGIMQANSFGVIDNAYCGDNDEWGFPAIATRSAVIPKGERICQFRVQLSQKATVWQKIKWLFGHKVELVPVSTLGNPDRGGFGEGTKQRKTNDKDTVPQTV